MADGAKIIGHLLGANTTKTTQKVSKASGTKNDSTELILAAAAPLLMSLLGQETNKTRKSSKNATTELAGHLLTAVLENVDVGSLLMNALSTSVSDEEKPKKKTATAKKKTAAKTTTATKKKSAANKKSASDDNGVDLADAASLLINLLK